MRKKVYRYFFGFLETQQKWLNRMVDNGFRLVRTTKLMYEFEPCDKGEFQYCVEFVGEKSYVKAKEYRQFLEDAGYRTFAKNINLNYSIGKVKWRPWGKGMGQISTSPGSYNKEILILEKANDGKPFKVHTTFHDLADYYKPLRNAYLSTAILGFLLSGWQFFKDRASIAGTIAFGIFGIAFLIPALVYSMQIYKLRKEAEIHE